MDEDENNATLLGFKNDNSTGITVSSEKDYSVYIHSLIYIFFTQRIHDYANIIKQLNQHRLIDNDFNLVADFQNVRNLSDIDKVKLDYFMTAKKKAFHTHFSLFYSGKRQHMNHGTSWVI
jgi:hypothetical protein